MLIIEGADLVGKTTLAHSIVSVKSPWGPLKYRRLGLLPGHWNYYNDYVNMMDHLVVQDRFHLSEHIYGTVCRFGTRMDEKLIARLDEMLMLYASVTVIITSNKELISKAFEFRGEDQYNLDQVLKVNDKFREIAHTHPLKYIHYDITNNGGIYPSSNEDFMDHVIERWMYGLQQCF